MPLQSSVVLIRAWSFSSLMLVFLPVGSLEEDQLISFLQEVSEVINSLCAMRSTNSSSSSCLWRRPLTRLLGRDHAVVCGHLVLGLLSSLASVRSPGERTWNKDRANTNNLVNIAIQSSCLPFIRCCCCLPRVRVCFAFRVSWAERVVTKRVSLYAIPGFLTP